MQEMIFCGFILRGGDGARPCARPKRFCPKKTDAFWSFSEFFEVFRSFLEFFRLFSPFPKPWCIVLLSRRGGHGSFNPERPAAAEGDEVAEVFFAQWGEHPT